MKNAGKVLRWIIVVVAIVNIVTGLLQIGKDLNQTGVIAFILIWLAIGSLAMFFEVRSKNKSKK